MNEVEIAVITKQEDQFAGGAARRIVEGKAVSKEIDGRSAARKAMDAEINFRAEQE